MSRRIAFMDVSPELLATLLSLPSGVKVLRAKTQEESIVGVEPNIRLTIEGGDLPEVASGAQIPCVSPQYSVDASDNWRPQFVSWGIDASIQDQQKSDFGDGLGVFPALEIVTAAKSLPYVSAQSVGMARCVISPEVVAANQEYFQNDSKEPYIGLHGDVR